MKNLPSPIGMSYDEITELLLREEYGYLPEAPFEVIAEEELDPTFYSGKCIMRHIRLTCKTKYGDFTFPVNYNCTGQLVCAGSTEELPQFYEEVKAAGGRALPLKVGGGFHSPFMTPAVEEFEKDLAGFEITAPSLPIYANLTAAPYKENVRETMCAQINHPVLWEKIILSMAEQGVTTFIETGVGNTLQKLVEKIVPDAKSYAVETKEQLDKVLAELGK